MNPYVEIYIRLRDQIKNIHSLSGWNVYSLSLYCEFEEILPEIVRTGFPPDDPPPGWTIDELLERFSHETLFHAYLNIVRLSKERPLTKDDFPQIPPSLKDPLRIGLLALTLRSCNTNLIECAFVD